MTVSEEEMQAWEREYTSHAPPTCPLCGSPMEIQYMGEGTTKYACMAQGDFIGVVRRGGSREEQQEAERHYRDSKVVRYWHRESPEILRLIAALRESNQRASQYREVANKYQEVAMKALNIAIKLSPDRQTMTRLLESLDNLKSKKTL